MLAKRFTVAVVGVSTLWTSSFAVANVGAMAAQSARIPPHLTSEEIFSHDSKNMSSIELRGKITAALSDEKLAPEFVKAGINRDEAKLRVAAMTDQELKQVQSNVERQAGGEVVIIGTTLLLIILIIVLLMR